MLPRFFQPGIAVANHAESGESIASSLDARRVDKVLSIVRPGDYVFAQFGHNDMKSSEPTALGLYKVDLRKLVLDVRDRGATPVLITSMERQSGIQRDTLGEYPATVRELAREENVPLIDLHAMSKELYRTLGKDVSRAFQDGSHHNSYGSYQLAQCVIQGIRKNRLILASSIADDARAYDPAYPDSVDSFQIPPSPKRSETKPEGN
jgi:lysophospholipase L1-like esterase